MPVSIRRAAPADVDALAALFAGFADEQSRLDARLVYSDDAVQRQRNTWRDALRSDAYAAFVAEAGGELIGYQSAEHWYEPPLYAGGREVFLHELYVLPAWRGRGIGTRLAGAAITWAEEEGAARLRFSVLVGNGASRALWERLGATPLAQTYTLELREAPPESAAPGRLGFPI